eukprot:6173222-Pleurochrysis_carterae.AAC.2
MKRDQSCASNIASKRTERKQAMAAPGLPSSPLGLLAAALRRHLMCPWRTRLALNVALGLTRRVICTAQVTLHSFQTHKRFLTVMQSVQAWQGAFATLFAYSSMTYKRGGVQKCFIY